jgi:hypothetical protein
MSEGLVIAIFSVLSTVMIGLQSWILTKIVAHEKQLYRLVSDAESEKDTRRRAAEALEKRLRTLEFNLKPSP